MDIHRTQKSYHTKNESGMDCLTFKLTYNFVSYTFRRFASGLLHAFPGRPPSKRAAGQKNKINFSIL